jgi:hypothetical protein
LERIGKRRRWDEKEEEIEGRISRREGNNF